MRNNQGLYKFTHNSFTNRGFAWAASIHPRSEVVHQECPKCGFVKYYPKGAFDVTLEMGSKYPDVLGCGAYPFLIVSDKVIKAWQEAGVCCFHTYDVKVAKIKSARLKDLPVPQYYRVDIDGSCRIDLEASGAKVVKFCSECLYRVTHPSVLKSFRMVSGSWDGSSLFRDQAHYPMVSFCTETIVKIAFQHRLTNFRFEPMAGPLEPGNKGIDYLAGHT